MSWKHIFAKKDLEMLLAEMAGEHRLHRVLGPVALTSLGVGCIIGAGIFVLTGVAAADDAGPAIMVSFAIAAVGCALAALCYAEFAAMAPVAGSAYTYAYTTLGEIFAWIIGWDLILEYAMGCATVASAWTKHLNELLEALGLWRVPDLALVRSVHRESAGSAVVQSAVGLHHGVRHDGAGARDSRERADQRDAGDDQAGRRAVGHRRGLGLRRAGELDRRFPWPSECLPQERVIPQLAKEHLRRRRPTPKRVDALTQPVGGHVSPRMGRARGRAAADRPAGCPPSEAAAMIADAREDDRGRHARRPRPTAHAVESLLPKVRAKGEEKAADSWGLLGTLGLNRWLIPIDDAFRSPVHALRPVGHHARGGDRVLRLHRIRLDLDPCRRGQKPAARRADRHPRFAVPLHGALHRGGGGHHGHDALSGDRRQCADRRGLCAEGRRRSRALVLRVATVLDLRRRTGRHDQRAAGAVPEPGADLHGHVARRPVAAAFSARFIRDSARRTSPRWSPAW